jgi:hypothetical protein
VLFREGPREILLHFRCKLCSICPQAADPVSCPTCRCDDCFSRYLLSAHERSCSEEAAIAHSTSPFNR